MFCYLAPVFDFEIEIDLLDLRILPLSWSSRFAILFNSFSTISRQNCPRYFSAMTAAILILYFSSSVHLTAMAESAKGMYLGILKRRLISSLLRQSCVYHSPLI